MRCWLLTVSALWLCGLPNANAQSERWLVLPTTSDDAVGWMRPAVDTVSRELRRQGFSVWASDATRARLSDGGSALPAALSETDIEAWKALSEGAVRKLAAGEEQAALDDLERAQALSREALETLNREPENARAVLDTCLYLVRAILATGDAQRAGGQIRECVRIAPLGEPTLYMHPPEVMRLYEDALGPNPARKGSLIVESEPSGCSVRINGAAAGVTPAKQTELYPGTYRVQLECEPAEPGHVHRVELGRGSSSLFIFDDFDRALRTEPVPHLHYEQPPESRRLLRDARELARMLPASAVLTVSAIGAETLEMRVATMTQLGPARARIPNKPGGPDASALAEATSALLLGQCLDIVADELVRLDCQTGRPTAGGPGSSRDRDRASRARPPRGQFVSGLALASLGSASLLSSYGLVIARRRAGSDWKNQPSSLAAQDKWLNLGTALIASSAAGSGMLVAAMPLLLPYGQGTPWWAWLSGGLGVAATAGSIASGVTAEDKPPQSCSLNGPDPAPCVERGRQIDRAIVLGTTAAPLLTMPLVYLLRKDDKKLGATLWPSLSASRRGGLVGLAGAF